MPPQASDDFYRHLQRLQTALVVAGRRAWSRVVPRAIDSSWQQSSASLVQVVTAAQLAAATAATAYVPAVLDETGQPDEPLARVRPRAFTGVASDGRDLSSLLEGSTRLAKAAVGRGVATDAALDLGGRWLEGALQTIATDAARDAVAAQVIVRENMGWVRAINPPCCSRCAVLAGKWFSWNADFPRHPRCDCYAIPSVENRAGDFTTDPNLLVQRGMVTDLSRAQQKRLADGGDLSRVLNESRDAWRARLMAQRRSDQRSLKRASWSDATDLPPVGTSIHDLIQRLTDRANAINAMRAAGITD